MRKILRLTLIIIVCLGITTSKCNNVHATEGKNIQENVAIDDVGYCSDAICFKDEQKNQESEFYKFTYKNEEVLKDGIYYIETALNSDYVIGIKDESVDNLANVELQKKTNSASQQWKVTHDEKGYVFFENIKSGKYLDLDKGGVFNYSNVQQYESNGLYPQKWIVIQDDKGMRIIPSANSMYSLDLSWGSVNEGSNIQIYEDLNNQPQRWIFTDTSKDYTMDDMAYDNKDVIEDGIYYIETSLDPNYVVGIQDGNMANLVNVELQKNKYSAYQQWKVTHDEKGYVSFENVKSGKMFDLDRGAIFNYSNVQQYESNGLYPQKWIVIQDDKGMRIIPAANRSYSLDLSWGNVKEGSNIQIYEDLNNQPQRWKFTKVEKIYTMDDMAFDNRDTLVDGIYEISSSLDCNYVIGVNNNSIENFGNVELQKRGTSLSQLWKISHDEKGYVYFENVKSGKMFDLDKGGIYNYSNVQQYESNGLYPQKWIVLQDDKGMRIVPSASKDFSLDLSMGAVVSGGNIQIYSDLNNQPQRWLFRKVDEFELPLE